VGHPFRRGRGAEGAAAVEFALVMPILFLIVFAIIQYGLWFNDSLNTRQGVREGARLGVVGDFTTEGTCTGTSATNIACKTVRRIDALSGTAYVKVTASSWTKGQPLTVCALVKTETVGLLPMPSNGWIFSRTEMSIEKATPAPSPLTATSASLPAGAPAWPSGC
jgi:Flp pilus assembly protein TadG